MPEWNQIDDLPLEMPELNMPDMSNFNLVDL